MINIFAHIVSLRVVLTFILLGLCMCNKGNAQQWQIAIIHDAALTESSTIQQAQGEIRAGRALSTAHLLKVESILSGRIFDASYIAYGASSMGVGIIQCDNAVMDNCQPDSYQDIARKLLQTRPSLDLLLFYTAEFTNTASDVQNSIYFWQLKMNARLVDIRTFQAYDTLTLSSSEYSLPSACLGRCLEQWRESKLALLANDLGVIMGEKVAQIPQKSVFQLIIRDFTANESQRITQLIESDDSTAHLKLLNNTAKTHAGIGVVHLQYEYRTFLSSVSFQKLLEDVSLTTNISFNVNFDGTKKQFIIERRFPVWLLWGIIASIIMMGMAIAAIYIIGRLGRQRSERKTVIFIRELSLQAKNAIAKKQTYLAFYLIDSALIAIENMGASAKLVKQHDALAHARKSLVRNLTSSLPQSHCVTLRVNEKTYWLSSCGQIHLGYHQSLFANAISLGYKALCSMPNAGNIVSENGRLWITRILQNVTINQQEIPPNTPVEIVAGDIVDLCFDNGLPSVCQLQCEKIEHSRSMLFYLRATPIKFIDERHLTTAWNNYQDNLNMIWIVMATPLPIYVDGNNKVTIGKQLNENSGLQANTSTLFKHKIAATDDPSLAVLNKNLSRLVGYIGYENGFYVESVKADKKRMENLSQTSILNNTDNTLAHQLPTRLHRLLISNEQYKSSIGGIHIEGLPLLGRVPVFPSSNIDIGGIPINIGLLPIMTPDQYSSQTIDEKIDDDSKSERIV